MKVCLKRGLAFSVALLVLGSSLVLPAYAGGISFDEGGIYGKILSWVGGSVLFDDVWGTDHSGNYAANKPQAYYTTPTESVEDKYGNVTNYYRGGDTTTTKIIDSYNHTFNTIHNTTNNTTNNTNNYSANVKLQDFLNTYTTNNNNYTYSADFKSWYYDNTSNTYQYDNSQTYYNTDNSQYYISIDNSTDEYYLVDVQYSPTFVTVNYTYNTTNVNNTTNYGDVTNVYYFELTDGRNSSTLSADEVAGLDLGYDVANYELVTDDPNTLSLQHFDGDYTDCSSYGRTFYSENRSSNYVDSGEFGKAVKLPSGSAAGVKIPSLSSYDGLTFDFRVYYDNPSSLGVYIGDTNIFQEIVAGERNWTLRDYYDDHNGILTNLTSDGSLLLESIYTSKLLNVGSYYSFDYLKSIHKYKYVTSEFYVSTTIPTPVSPPSSFSSSGFDGTNGKKYGWMSYSSSVPVLSSSATVAEALITFCEEWGDSTTFKTEGTKRHYIEKVYSWSPSRYILADFSCSTYANQWVPMRITIDDGKLYYFVNGDLVGSGNFSTPSVDKFYIKSSGTLYLDELRVTTGDMVSNETYTPSGKPYDTNKVLALPNTLSANTIYARHSTPVSSWRVGGVRPSNPSTGFLYIPLYDDYTGGQAQLYDGANWVDVEAMVYDGSTSKSVKGYKFTPMGASSDVNMDLKEPDGSDDPESDGSCSHNWEETSRKDATCTLSGSVTYTCSKCEGTKTETLVKLSHDWEVKQSVQTSYDETGNILTEGFTIYRCIVCNEEYKDTTGSGPPSAPAPDEDEEEEEGFLGWLGGKLGDLFGALGDGIISLLEATLGKILDSLITLVETVFEKLSKVVNLFGSFGDALSVVWSWLPEDVVSVLVLGVTIFVFLGVIKLFFK